MVVFILVYLSIIIIDILTKYYLIDLKVLSRHLESIPLKKEKTLSFNFRFVSYSLTNNLKSNKRTGKLRESYKKQILFEFVWLYDNRFPLTIKKEIINDSKYLNR